MCNPATSNDSTCKGWMDSAQGTQATVKVDYSCTNLIVYGTNYLPGCTLSSTTSMRIE